MGIEKAEDVAAPASVALMVAWDENSSYATGTST